MLGLSAGIVRDLAQRLATAEENIRQLRTFVEAMYQTVHGILPSKPTGGWSFYEPPNEHSLISRLAVLEKKASAKPTRNKKR